ncbi:MAG TPA: lipid-binding SYLF domain-containing protein [Woeseiaceae bacterium]|nr:lipid-binding SYLF domain-containing protein [Woeseiaceae bacterium]
MRTLITAWICAAVLLTGAVRAETPEEQRLTDATEVLEQLADIPENGIPPALLGSAYGVAVIPNVVKVGLVVGARWGRGVLVVRQPDGQWSQPTFISVTGGSVGWQAGAQSSDLILVFKNRRGVQGITDGKLTLGADASVAAGPVGRYTSASTDIRLRSEVYSYSRTRGLFLGVALDGAALSIDQSANAAFYAQPGVSAEAIFAADGVTAPVEARRFIATLTRLTPEDGTALPPSDRDAGAGGSAAEGGDGPEPAVRTYGIGDGAGEPPPADEPGEPETFEPVEPD